jgi:hypothetical protein
MLVNIIIGNIIFGVLGGLSGFGVCRMLKRETSLALALVFGAVLPVALLGSTLLGNNTHAPLAVLALRLWPMPLIGMAIAWWQSREAAKRIAQQKELDKTSGSSDSGK